MAPIQFEFQVTKMPTDGEYQNTPIKQISKQNPKDLPISTCMEDYF